MGVHPSTASSSRVHPVPRSPASRGVIANSLAQARSARSRTVSAPRRCRGLVARPHIAFRPHVERLQQALETGALPIGEAEPPGDRVRRAGGPRRVGVEQGREPPHRVGPDGLQADASGDDPCHHAQATRVAGLRQHMFEHAVAAHQKDDLGRVRGHQDAQEFVPDPLCGQLRQLVCLVSAGGERVPVRRRSSVGPVEAKEPEQPKHVLRDALVGQSDETHTAVGEVCDAVEGIVDVALEAAGHGIDREIPAAGVLDPVVGIGDAGAATVGLHVDPKRGDLESPFADDRGHGSVLDAGRQGP